MELLKVLASKLGVREAEGSVTGRVEELIALSAGLQTLFGLGRDDAQVLLTAAKDTAAAKEKLIGLFTALGVPDAEAAVAKVAEVMSSAAKLKEVMPELEGLRADKVKKDEQEAEQDVAEAIAACKLHPSVAPALKLFRKQSPEEFAKTYPKQTGTVVTASAQNNPAQVHQLTQPLVTSPNGSAVQLGGRQVPQVMPTVHGQGETVNLAMYSGANKIARAKAYLSRVVQNWSQLSNDDQWLRAKELTQQPNVIDQAAG